MKTWSVDVRHLAIGYYLGGAAGHVVACAVCGLGAVRMSDTTRKGQPHARFAHLLEFELNAKNDPVCKYENKHITPQPYRDQAGQRAANPSPANDNNTPNAEKKHAV